MKIEERFPIGCYVVMKHHQRKYSYYTSDELKVIGYGISGSLILDLPTWDGLPTRSIGDVRGIHPDNVELSKRWLREKKIEFLFNI
jgi:hypothetical protein